MTEQTASEAFELLLLDALPGVGPATVRALVERFGSATAALVAPDRDFGAISGSEAARMRGSADLRHRVEAGLRDARASGCVVVTWNDPGWPRALRHLADPPPVLFLRGDASLLARPGVTVVGSRRATERARDVARRLGAAIARAGRVVVSGMALGVDGAAHAGALAASGGTIAVLGTGADVVYPRTHRRLYECIVERGLVVSEFLPGTHAMPHHFPRRNRILAALSSATVVVEAGARSGALITVDHALDLGAEVWSVPGPIDRATSAGSNRLLADGARPLVSIDDFAATVRLEPDGPVQGASAEDGDRPTRPGGPGRPGAGGRPAPGSPEASWPPLTPEERVRAALAAEPQHVDDVAGRACLPVETTLALLTTLELFGEAERLPGMRYRRAA